MTSAMNGLGKDLDDRLDTVGWGAFFLWSGVVLLMPALPDGTWLTGVGALILGLGAVRANAGLRVSTFWTILGAGFVALGVGAMAGLALPWFSLLLVVCGIGLVASETIRQPREAQRP